MQAEQELNQEEVKVETEQKSSRLKNVDVSDELFKKLDQFKEVNDVISKHIKLSIAIEKEIRKLAVKVGKSSTFGKKKVKQQVSKQKGKSVSKEFIDFFGMEENQKISRPDACKKVYAYIADNNLRGEKERSIMINDKKVTGGQIIVLKSEAGKKLAKMLGTDQEEIAQYNIQSLLSKHFKAEEKSTEGEEEKVIDDHVSNEVKVASVPAPVATPVPVDAGKAKRTISRKKVSSGQEISVGV